MCGWHVDNGQVICTYCVFHRAPSMVAIALIISAISAVLILLSAVLSLVLLLLFVSLLHSLYQYKYPE